jgi:DNA-binding CsgD family transcriptional regulator
MSSPTLSLVSATNPLSSVVSDDDIARVYRYTVAKTAVDAVETAAEDLDLDVVQVRAAIDHLIECRLLRVESEGQLIVPVAPDIAMALLVSPMEREIYQRREQIAKIRERIEVFRQDYARFWRAAPDPAPVERVNGATEVRGCLQVAGDDCVDELLALQPDQFDGEQFEDLLRLCADLLARGVAVRMVCQHKSRADLSTRMKLKAITDAGAVVRTVSHLPRSALVFDGTLAVLLGDVDAQATAARVRNGDVVAFLLDVFTHVWDAATPLERFDAGYERVADDLQSTILGLMAKGFTDEALARKLGMSVRTCRRHIAAMMRELDAVSRFQAGVQAARRSMVAHA